MIEPAGERRVEVDDLAGGCLFGRYPLQGLHGQDADDALPGPDAILRATDDGLARADPASCDPADREPPAVGVVVDVADHQLQGPLGVGDGCGDAVQQRLQQWLQRRPRVAEVGGGGPTTRVRVDHGRVELLGTLGELQQQVMSCFDGFRGAGVDPVDLVDHDDRDQPERERLPQHHPCLRHRPLGGIDQQEAPVRHAEHAFHLAAEVGVPRRVDDVDLDASVPDRRRLGQDRDPLLAFQVARVQDQLADLLVCGENVRLLQKGIDQRGLAMVDVGDDRHVAQVGAAGYFRI